MHLKTVKSFSDDINVKFGLHNWAKVICKQRELISIESIILDIDTGIKGPDLEAAYEYLDWNEADGIQCSKMKETCASGKFE